MSGFRIKYKVLAISVCLVFAGWAAVSAEEFLPVSEVREGMHGYAKTVVHGTQVETFDVDVLGVVYVVAVNDMGGYNVERGQLVDAFLVHGKHFLLLRCLHHSSELVLLQIPVRNNLVRSDQSLARCTTSGKSQLKMAGKACYNGDTTFQGGNRYGKGRSSGIEARGRRPCVLLARLPDHRKLVRRWRSHRTPEKAAPRR